MKKDEIITVEYSPLYGPPGELAHKLHLLITRRALAEGTLEEAFRVGSMDSIARELGMPEGAESDAAIANALRQIENAVVTNADDVGETKAGFPYSVILPNQKLPDGREADAAYVLFSHAYLKYLKHL